MREAQALDICGYFAKGLDAHFILGENDYLIHRYAHGTIMSIHGPDDEELVFEVVDMSVTPEGCFVIDLYDFQMRIDLEEGA